MIRTIQGDFAPDDSLFLQRPWTQGMPGIVAYRSRLTDTVVIEPEARVITETEMNTVPYVYVPPTPSTTLPPTTAPPTTTPGPTTTVPPPTTTTVGPTTTTVGPTTTTLAPTTTLGPTTTLPPITTTLPP